jgi:hypothetical protein
MHQIDVLLSTPGPVLFLDSDTFVLKVPSPFVLKVPSPFVLKVPSPFEPFEPGR